MGEWKKTGCVLCAQNCGLEVYVEDNRILRSRVTRTILVQRCIYAERVRTLPFISTTRTG